jgi:hypothetical protein
MLRIQFDGFTIEIGRDRSASPTAFLLSALPVLFGAMRANGLGSVADFFSGVVDRKETEPN